MTTTSNSEEVQLKSGALGVPGLVAIAAGGIAPEYSILLTGSVVAGIAGGATPAAFVIAAIGMFAFGIVMAGLSRHVSAAGGLYSFVRRGLGRDVGYLVGWFYLGIGVVVTPATFISSAFLLQNFFAAAAPDVNWLSSSWVPWAIVLTPIVLFAAYRGVEISARLLLVLAALGVSSVVLFDLIILIKGGKDGIAWSSLSPFSLHGISVGTLLLAVGLAITCLAGSEGAVFMAEEAHDPRRTVPRAIMGTMTLVVVFYVLTSLAVTTGLGTTKTSGWGLLGADVVSGLSKTYLVSWYGTYLLAIVAIAGITGALAFTNYLARLIFEWGRDGHLPRMLGRTHRVHQTPHAALGAIAVMSIIGYACSFVLTGGTAADGLVAFSWMYTVDAVLIALVYPTVAIAGAVVGLRAKAGLLTSIIAPVVTVALIGLSIKSQFFPLPPSPYRGAVLFGLGWIVAGVLVRLATRRNDTGDDPTGEELALEPDDGIERLPA
ncbi:APC family permease [Flexivirga endophytica]|uniref:APC family permease n=1 Tax=Flexivirga endophytica TaxID=1849103 RepID=UPI00166565A9|nr:APC family permease [Flexivirga endophytica]